MKEMGMRIQLRLKHFCYEIQLIKLNQSLGLASELTPSWNVPTGCTELKVLPKTVAYLVHKAKVNSKYAKGK